MINKLYHVYAFMQDNSCIYVCIIRVILQNNLLIRYEVARIVCRKCIYGNIFHNLWKILFI